MFKKLLNSQSKTITSAAIVLAAASLASRFLGLWRDRILAGTFGAGDELDIYFAAFRLPDLVYNLLVLGALYAAFIPVFTSYAFSVEDKNSENAKVKPEAWYLANGILNLTMVGLIIIGGIFFLAAPLLVPLMVPGFSGEKLHLTVQLTQLMFLSPIFLGLSTVFSGILQSFKKFFVYSLAPIMYNLGIIFGALVLVRLWGLYGLAAGVVLGAILHMLIQIPSVLHSGWRYQWILDFSHRGIQKIIKLSIPRTLSLAINQLNFVGLTFIASGLAAGSLAIFNFAYNIWSFPLGIIAASFAVAAFPTLSLRAHQKDWSGFAKSFSSAFRQILFFIIPISVLLLILRAQIVRVILGTGKFDWQDTILTIQSLQYFTFGLFADSLALLLIRGFFALEDTKTPFILGLISTVVRLFFVLILVKYLFVPGLALGYAIGSVINVFLLWFFLRKKIGDLDRRTIWQSCFKIFASSFLAGLVAWLMLRVLATLVNMNTGLGIFTQGFIAGLIGMAVYVLSGLLFRSKEMLSFWQVVRHRLPFKTVAPDKELIQE